MTDGETQPDPPPPSRKPIILIGAPSGAGKTVLSRRIIAGEVPFFAQQIQPKGKPIVRYDLKVLPNDPPHDQVLIIECSTYKFHKLVRSSQWRRMLTLARESDMVVHVTLSVPRRTIVQQFFRRIFTGPKRMHLVYRILQLSKYRTALVYLLTRELARSDEAWHKFGNELSKEMPSRVTIVRAQRTGAEYQLHLEEAPVLSPAPPHPLQSPVAPQVPGQ